MNVMMEKRPPLTSADGSRNTPERCPRSLNSQDYTQQHQEDQKVIWKHQEIPQEHQESPQEDQKVLWKYQEIPQVYHKISQEHREVTQKHQEIPWHDQDEGFIVVKLEAEEEMSMMDDEPCKEERSPEISSDTRDCRRDIKEEEEDHVRVKEEETLIEISTDKSRNRNTPERCPRPLYSQDSTQEHQEDQYSTANPSKRKRIVLTLKQKMEVCKRLEKGESRAVLMKEYNIGSSTIYEIKARSQKIKEFYAKSESDNSVEKRHTLHTPKMEVLDQALYEWFVQKRSEGSCVSGPMLQEKAREFHEKLNIEGQCSFSSGWLTRFKIRHGIRKLDLSGEPRRPVDTEAAASFSDMFSNLAAENGLTPEQIYNADETGIMWKCLPNSALAGSNEKVYKLSKERITVLVCANASGNHKVRLSVIGKYAKPSCLQGITTLPVDYHTQRNSWMDANIFTKWFHHSFVPSVKDNLREKGIPEESKVMLLLDNSRGHPPADELVNGNVFVCYLPPGVQPMSQGAMQNLKMLYRRDFMRKLIHFDGTNLDFQKKFNLKDAVYTAACAWDSVKSETLQECWRKLWPAGMSSTNELAVNSTTVYEEICSLADSAKDKMTLSRVEINDWLAVDEAVLVTPTINKEEIIEDVVNGGKGNYADEEESDDNRGLVEKVSWQRATEAFETLIMFAEQQPFFTLQHVMQLHRMQNLMLDERRRAQQDNVGSYFKKAALTFDDMASHTVNDSKASTSTDPVPATCPHHIPTT